jgi:hypothetical protein
MHHKRLRPRWAFVSVVLAALACATLVLLSGLDAGRTLLAGIAVQDNEHDISFKPGDTFGNSYEVPAERLRAYSGGVAWHRNQGWSFAESKSLPAPTSFPGTLSGVSAAIKRSEVSLDRAAGGADDDSTGVAEEDSGGPWSVPAVTDEDYKRDVMRGVLEKHAGFPSLPDCPTEGLWGSYRAGYAPGQKLGAGNCQDYSLRSTGIPANALKPKLGFNVKTWDNLWKADLDGLKKARSYAKLTKGLWSKVAPDAAMAYYVPNSYKGSLAEYYEQPRGERTASEDNAHTNSIVPVPRHKGEYYVSDFTRGEASEAAPTVGRVAGNRAGSVDSNNMAYVTEGLYARSNLQQQHEQQQGKGGGGGVARRAGVLERKEKKVMEQLRQLNQSERRQLAATRAGSVVLHAVKPSLTSLLARPRTTTREKDNGVRRWDEKTARGGGEGGGGGGGGGGAGGGARRRRTYRALAAVKLRGLSEGNQGLVYPSAVSHTWDNASDDDADGEGRAGGEEDGVEGTQEEETEEEEAAEAAVRHFRHLRDRLYRWRKYFRSNRYDGKEVLDSGVPAVEGNAETGDGDAYFWCYAHYGDLSPDKLPGQYPDFEECLHVLGSAKWGSRQGGDEAMAFGDTMQPRPGIENTLKGRRGFGDGWVAASKVEPKDFKYFENQDEEFGGETRNAKVSGIQPDDELQEEQESGQEGGGVEGEGKADGGGAGSSEVAGLEGLVKGLSMSSGK